MLTSVPAVCGLALLLDYLFGEPRRAHPLVGFGSLAARLESAINCHDRTLDNIVRGALSWALLVAPPVLLTAVAHEWLAGRWLIAAAVFDGLVLYLAIGWRSMREHAMAVYDALRDGSRERARQALGRIVSRDCAQASEAQALSATVETTLENSADALFASLFWYCLAGAPGVVLHRLANTLDAMWGYRTPRFGGFGKWGARADDVLGFLPCQLLALTFALLSGRLSSRHALVQGWRWKSVNAGAVMAAGAYALGIQLGGPAVYHGHLERREALGGYCAPRLDDLPRTFRLVRYSLIVWLTLIVFIFSFRGFLG